MADWDITLGGQNFMLTPGGYRAYTAGAAREDGRPARQRVSDFRGGPGATGAHGGALFGSQAVRRATDRSSFSLQDGIDGQPMTIHLIIPPNKLGSHRSLLCFWLGVMLMALMLRREPPPQRTLLIVDEAALLGTMHVLQQTVTLYRGCSVQAWLLV